MENCRTLNIFFADIVTILRFLPVIILLVNPLILLMISQLAGSLINTKIILTLLPLNNFVKKIFCSFQFVEKNFVLNKKRSLNVTKSAQEIDKII